MLSILRSSRVAIATRSLISSRTQLTGFSTSVLRRNEAKESSEPQPPSEEVKKQLAEKDKQISELKDHYLRSLADMENLRQRTRKEVENTANFAIQKFVKDIVGTVDVLGLALKSVTAEQRSASKELNDFYTGVSMTETELNKTLQRHGVEPLNPVGEEFDPNLHQALYQAPAPGKNHGSILSVEKIGFTLNGRVIRPAQVGVVKNE